MMKKARLGIYLDDDEIKKQIKIASVKHGVSITDYCVEAIEERLIKDGEISIAKRKFRKTNGDKLAHLERMERLRKEIGPIGVSASQLVKEGRRR